MARQRKKPYAEQTNSPERLDTQVSDLIFVSGRDRTTDPIGIRANALESANFITIDAIKDIATLAEAREVFDKLYRESNVALNADLTIAFKNDQTGPLPTLYEKIFFSIKRILGIKRGLSNIREKIFTNLDLKREFLLARIRADLLEAFQTVCKDEADRQRFVSELLTDAVPTAAASDAPALELPACSPAWWRDRQPGETPDNWLRTHYKPFIDAGLITRGFFQRPHQDKAFSNALLAWEQQGNQLPPDLYIPTKSELIDRQLQEMGGIDKAREQGRIEHRNGSRLYHATLRRLR